MQRRDCLKSLALVPVAIAASIIPVSATDDIQVPQNAKSFIERAKYLDYTELDYLQCKLVLRDADGNKQRTRLFNKVVLSKDPLKVVMQVQYDNPPVGLKVVSVQFMDKDRRCLFTPRPTHSPTVTQGDSIKFTYTLNLT